MDKKYFDVNPMIFSVDVNVTTKYLIYMTVEWPLATISAHASILMQLKAQLKAYNI